MRPFDRQQTHQSPQRQRTTKMAALALTCFGLSLSGCSKDSTPASGTFSHVYTQTLATACANCHSPTGMATAQYNVQLNFSSQAAAYQTLTSLNVTGDSSTGTCSAVRIVTPSDPQKSYLAAVLFEEYHTDNFAVTGCTPYTVHHQDQNLSAAEQESIIAWINSGAPNN